jgi:uncharacterized MAPEG superfamily protein
VAVELRRIEGGRDMTTELTMLTCAVGLTILQLLVVIAGAMTQAPLSVLVGNRETPVEGKGWVGRAQRAHRNMLESLLPFAAVVLVAHAAGISNEYTVLGTKLFLYGRIAYTIVYVAGIPWLRTVVWVAALAGMLMVLAQLA